jgi:hypothetical protein
LVKIGSSANAAPDQIVPANSATTGNATVNTRRLFIPAPSCPGDGDVVTFEHPRRTIV